MSGADLDTHNRLYIRYAIAAAAVLVAFALRQCMVHYLGLNLPAFITFYPAVMLVAILGGFWPGLMATVLAALLADYWIFPPIGNFAIADTSHAVSVVFFTAMGVFMSFVAERYGRSQKRMADYERDQVRREATKKLLQSEEQFRTLANAIPQLCWMANADGWIFWYNERWYRYTGTEPKQMEGWGWQSVHDPGTLPEVLERWKASIATGEPFDMVFPLRGADGIFRPFLTRGMPVRNQDGKVARWFGTNTDITAQKQAEDEVRNSRDLLEMFVENAPAGLVMLDRKMRHVRLSKKWQLETGIGARDIVGKNHYEVFPNLPEHWKAAHQRGLAGESLTGEDNWIAADGQMHTVSWGIHPWGDSGTETGGIIIFSEDITDHKRAEEELRQLSEQRRVAMEVAELGSWDYHFSDGIVLWDERCRNMWGVPTGDRIELNGLYR